MTLYHFLSAQHIAKVRMHGLTRGILPWNLDKATGEPGFKRGFQWLTTNPSFDQAWCLLGDLPIAKNGWRITVNVPKAREERVINWLELCRRYRPDAAEEINAAGGDVDNWRLYHGGIPPTWFVEILRNPSMPIMPEDFLINAKANGHG